MDLSEIIRRIGEGPYRAACQEATRLAPETGDRLHEGFHSSIPTDIGSLIWWKWEGDLAVKLDVTLRIYEQMPCYGLLSWVSMHFGEFDQPTKAGLWDRFRAFLSAEASLADPVGYSLWCDYFEGEDRVAEAWAELTREPAGGRLLERVLRHSGPVPYELKDRLYRRLLPDPRWHEHIRRSIDNSEGDLYGDIDFDRAGEVMDRIDRAAGSKADAKRD